MTGAVSDDCLTDLVAELRMDVREEPGADWPLALSRHSCVATIAARSAEPIAGFSCAPTAGDARRRAIMECLERYAQFGCAAPRTIVATEEALGAAAISPEALGLYSEDQYDAPRFPFARYSKEEALEWVALTDVTKQQLRYLPVEFVYPHAPIERRPLVGETSSGTAAHCSRTLALLAAVCEVIERDSLMMFWHRQPPTNALSIDPAVSAVAARDLELIRTMRFVAVVCLLQYDLAIPCVLALALQGDRFAYGAGCHPCLNSAMEHALGELGSLLRWQLLKGGRPRRWVSLAEIRKPADHYALYDGGPFHDLIRQTLENTIRAPKTPNTQSSQPAMPSDEALETVVDGLQARGYRVYECDLTPPEMRPYCLSVVRTFVPGLLPLYFGSDHIRLGCRRLWDRQSPGRLCTLLPHFMT
jgi:ribosomal protein S12 methylthiotransferase accessory factor